MGTFYSSLLELRFKKNGFFLYYIKFFFNCQMHAHLKAPPIAFNFQPKTVAYGGKIFQWHFQPGGAAQGYSKRRVGLQLSTKWRPIWGKKLAKNARKR